MKLSHVLYKTNDLNDAVKKFESQGFKVEYGSKTNPHNALIYFSEGPYIELLEKVTIPILLKWILRLLGKGKVIDRIERWGNAPEGFMELCLENYDTDFRIEEEILKRHNQSYFITKSKRLDPYDRLLKWKMLFPYELDMPFFMTYFKINPKPANFTHPNGIKKIKRVTYGTTTKLSPLINALVDDETLNLVDGKVSLEVIYEK